MDAILFWDRFEGRWLRGSEFHYPERPENHAFNAGFKLDLAYILVTVDLEEGVRMQVPLRGAKEADVKLGLPVRVIFEQAKPDLVTPACVTAS